MYSFIYGRTATLDYEQRLKAYEELDEFFVDKSQEAPCGVLCFVPILYCVINDLHSDDITLRSCAAECLRKFLDAVPSVTSETEDAKELKESGDRRNRALEVLSTMFGQADRIICPAIAKGFESGSDAVVVESISLLSRAADKLPSIAGSLKVFRDENDPESDLFENLSHLQRHRRMRALKRLETSMTTDEGRGVTERVIRSFLIPLCWPYLRSCKSKEGIEANLADAAAKTIGALSQRYACHYVPRLLSRLCLLYTRQAEFGTLHQSSPKDDSRCERRSCLLEKEAIGKMHKCDHQPLPLRYEPPRASCGWTENAAGNAGIHCREGRRSSS